MTNEGICREFHDYFQKFLTRKLGFSYAQSDTYLADFPSLEATEAVGVRDLFTVARVW